MQRKLCLGLGVVLLGVAALLYFNGSGNSDSDFRVVERAEATTVLGGGLGLDIQWLKCSLHADAPTSCSATITAYGKYHNVAGGTYMGSSEVKPCGGNCSGYTERTTAPE